MKWKIFNQPIGSVQPIGSTKKEMPIPLAVPLVMAAGSALSSWIGGNKAADAAKAQQDAIAREKARLEAERLRKMNESYIDTAAGQNLIRIAKEQAEENWRKAAGAAAVGGATDAAAQMAKDAGNKMVGDTIANISAQDTARKDNADASYRSEIAGLTQQQIAAEGAKAQATSQATGALSSALMNAGISAFGGTKLGQSWFGSPGGAGVSAQGIQTGFTGYNAPVRLLPTYNSNYGGLMGQSPLYNMQSFWNIGR